MLFRVGLENNFEGRSVAWSLEHPGCFSERPDGETALAELPAAIQAYARWIERHGAQLWFEPDKAEIRVEEVWDVYYINEDYERVVEGYEVNAWFQHDWKPLTDQDVERGLQLLSWSRADLLEAVQDLSPEALEAHLPGEQWNISRILNHVGGAEWWYQDRLGLAFPRSEVPEKPAERLEAVRAHLVALLPELTGSMKVVGTEGEFWSPRKLLRRAVWHELHHLTHIRELVHQMESG